MASVNRAILIGNLGHDPVFRMEPDGTPVANFNLATNLRHGEKTYTEWHKVKVTGALAESTRDAFKKGDCIYVTGSLRTHRWKTKRTQEERQAIYILADTAQIVDDREPPIQY